MNRDCAIFVFEYNLRKFSCRPDLGPVFGVIARGTSKKNSNLNFESTGFQGYMIDDRECIHLEGHHFVQNFKNKKVGPILSEGLWKRGVFSFGLAKWFCF